MKFDLSGASISIDEGGPFYVGTFVLANYLDGAQFQVDTPFVFDMYGELYSFIVDSKSFNKPEIDPSADLQVTINCLSPAVQLIAPRAQLITKTWSTTTAKTVAEEVLAGYPMDWQILDWPLTNNLFSANQQAPLEVVKALVEAVGALVECLPNGSLVVRYAFPVPVPTYGPAVADHVFSESDELVAGSEGFTASKLLDRFRIMNSQAALGSDRLEFEEPVPGLGQGVLRAYPNPWRTHFVVESTNSAVVIGVQEYEEREETETIEIVNGKGSVKYPVLAVVDVDFLDTDLTGISTLSGSTEITTTSVTQFYSLLRLTYKVRSLRYNVLGVVGDSVQFLMKEA